MSQTKGQLHVAYGPMGAGKTGWLIDKFLPGVSVAFVPGEDTRSAGILRTHDGIVIEKDVVVVPGKAPEHILAHPMLVKVKRVLIDEINFFSDSLVGVVEQLVNQGFEVYGAGLLLDSDLSDFGPTRKLALLSTHPTKLMATCDWEGCLQAGLLNYYKGVKTTQVAVGAFDHYGVSCERHYQLFRTQFNMPSISRWTDQPWIVKGTEISWRFSGLVKEMDLGRRIRDSRKRWPRIEVMADSMRVGKTTAVGVLSRKFDSFGWPVETFYEDWQHNPYLAKSYENPQKAFLLSQKWFIRHKYKQVLKSMKQEAIVVQDLSPEGDVGYAVANVTIGRMPVTDFADYLRVTKALAWQRLAKPDVLVYLKAGDTELIKRAQKSARKFEVIDPKYFLTLKRINRHWLQTVKAKWQIVEVDTDNFDFSRNIRAQKELVSRVLNILRRQGWELEAIPHKSLSQSTSILRV